MRPTHRSCSSALALCALASCGRIAFDERSDAGDAGGVPASGALDPSFGTGGLTLVESPGATELRIFDLARRGTGYVLGGHRSVSQTYMVLVAFTMTGQVDTTFGVNGFVELGTTGSDFGKSLLAYGNRLVVVGDAYVNGSQFDDVELAVVDPQTGAPDTAYSLDGYATFGGTLWDTSTQVRYDSNGAALIATGNLGYDIALSQSFILNSSLDGMTGTFNNVDVVPGGNELALDVLVLPDGYLAVGSTDTGSFAFKLTLGFIADSAFGTNGIITTSDGMQTHAISRLDNGDLALVGTGPVYGGVMIMGPDGTIRATNSATAFGDSNVLIATCVVEGGFIAAGWIVRGADTNALLVRYRNDGTLDTSFGTGGALEVDAGGLDYIKAVNRETDGSLIAGGYSTLGTVDRAMIMRIR